MKLWTPWTNSLADTQPVKDIGTMAAMMTALRRKLQDSREASET